MATVKKRKATVPSATPLRQELGRIGYSTIYTLQQSNTVFFYEAGMTIDADGAYRAYHPDNRSGLDYLGNAGRPGNWWALVTDNGKASGNPVIQGANDPAPGFYVSTTSLQDTTKARTDPRRYVDAASVPFIVLPSNGRFGAALGDFCMVYNPAKQKLYGGVFADVGPKGMIGEASIAMASAVGVPGNPKNGGQANGLIYVVFTGSATGWPLALADIQQKAQQLFTQWGGISLLQQVLPEAMA